MGRKKYQKAWVALNGKKKKKQKMELSKFCKKALFFRHTHPCHTEPRGSDKLQINISFFVNFSEPKHWIFCFTLALHLYYLYSSPLPLKSYSKSQKMHSKAVCVVKAKYDTLYLYHCVCLL